MQPVERAEYEGVDYGWVMQTTFVVTILVGAPIVAVLSAFVTLDSWGARAAFAVRVGAPIWFVTAVAVAVYARRTDAGDGGAAETDETIDDATEDGDDDADNDAGEDSEGNSEADIKADSEGAETVDEDGSAGA
ncbi:DUF5822 domain-containing protein [Halorubrum kocurii]|uniref:Peptidoglycan-binding protein n=1 Tax=Halorubrum kocurii JCM 14978 TaxID=1230456 RepID=M0PAL5_9EURY|nr:DUF5822 domain-containing protein [Halorubrum kocurii]EMA67046.1 hypothetical protein C468_03273 [Halorubrum kocurii JCM 14978]